jgi:hypothetical protein
MFKTSLGRRAAERRRTAVGLRKKGEPKDRLKTGWRGRRRRIRRAGARPLTIGSIRVRAEVSGRYCPASRRVFSLAPTPALMSRGRDDVLFGSAHFEACDGRTSSAEILRAKRLTSSATNGASFSLDLKRGGKTETGKIRDERARRRPGSPPAGALPWQILH